MDTYDSGDYDPHDEPIDEPIEEPIEEPSGIHAEAERLATAFQRVAERAHELGFTSFWVISAYDPFSRTDVGRCGYAGSTDHAEGAAWHAIRRLFD